MKLKISLMKIKLILKNINLLIPAAGKGERFKKEGYKKSKINLELNNKTIMEHIISSFKNQNETLILTHQDDKIENTPLINENNIITSHQRTKGQAEIL